MDVKVFPLKGDELPWDQYQAFYRIYYNDSIITNIAKLDVDFDESLLGSCALVIINSKGYCHIDISQDALMDFKALFPTLDLKPIFGDEVGRTETSSLKYEGAMIHYDNYNLPEISMFIAFENKSDAMIFKLKDFFNLPSNEIIFNNIDLNKIISIK